MRTLSAVIEMMLRLLNAVSNRDLDPFVTLRSLRENTTPKTSFSALYQQQLTGTRVALITEGGRFKNRKSSCFSNNDT